jgi:hypothetical protein
MTILPVAAAFLTTSIRAIALDIKHLDSAGVRTICARNDFSPCGVF